MLQVLLLLWGFCLNAGLANAAMVDGQELKNAVFPDVVFIQNKAAPHGTLCLGSVFNSFTIFTADTCKLEVKEPTKYRVMPATQAVKAGFDVTKAKAFDVVKIETFKTSNFSGVFQTKIVRLGVPGMAIPTDAVTTSFITDWEDWLEIVRVNRTDTGAVMSFSIPPKAGAIQFKGVDTKECNTSYNTQREPDWPQYMSFEHFCIFKGQSSFNSTLGEIVPGMPCEDSEGSPVFALDSNYAPVVLGLLLKTKCSATPPFAVAIASPDFTIDSYYTPAPATDLPTTRYTRPSVKTSKRRTRRPRPGHDPEPEPKGRAAAIIIHFPLWCAVIFTGAYMGI